MSIRTPAHIEHFEKWGYAVLKGLLDPEDDFRALRTEYSTLLDTLASRWYAEGSLSSAYQGLELGARFAAVFRSSNAACSSPLNPT